MGSSDITNVYAALDRTHTVVALERSRRGDEGMQIMSPNFVMQPKAAVVVPQEAWYAAPAVAPQKPEK